MALLSRLRRWIVAGNAPATRNAFVGAATNRLTLDWIRAPLTSADRELEGDLLELRKRSRDLARNNTHVRRFVKMAQNNIAGPRGVQMRPANVRVTDGKPNDLANDRLEAAWSRWTRREHCTLAGRMSFRQLQRLVVAEWITSGEAIVQIVRDARNPFRFALHPIDADRVDQQFNRPAGPDGPEIRYGVEVDRVGRPLAYHILHVHPSEIGRVAPRSQYRERVPADEIVHLALLDERVDLTRGVPQLAVALRDLRHLDGAQEASVIALRANASNQGFIVTKSDATDAEVPTEDVYLDGDPFSYKALGVGQEIQVPQVNQPQDNYPDFTRALLRSIASGLGTSYAFLSGDWSDANFGSMRIGRADEQDYWEALQEWFIEEFCVRVFEAWLPAAIVSGQLETPDTFDIARIGRVEWQGRRWTSPKPLEDVEVYERRVALGLESRTEIMGREGRSLWTTWDRLAEEDEYAEKMGLDVEPPRKGAGVKDDGGTESGATAGAASSGDGAGDRAGGHGNGNGHARGRLVGLADPYFDVLGGAG